MGCRGRLRGGGASKQAPKKELTFEEQGEDSSGKRVWPVQRARGENTLHVRAKP